MFPAHALGEWAWPRAHTNVTTFTLFAQNYNNIIGSILASPVCTVARHNSQLWSTAQWKACFQFVTLLMGHIYPHLTYTHKYCIRPLCYIILTQLTHTNAASDHYDFCCVIIAMTHIILATEFETQNIMAYYILLLCRYVDVCFVKMKYLTYGVQFKTRSLL